MKFDVLNRFTGNVKFTAEIDCEQDTPRSLKLGLAVQWAVKTEADLTEADLTCANLTCVNLTCANLTEANLTWANLTEADLTWANLTEADLTWADWVPKIKNIHQTVYEAASKPKALEMADWHTCETTHCRAGWVVHLAGNAGRVMEGVYGTGSAAALIYMVSDPSMKRVPNWTDTNENALADMKRLAELEKELNEYKAMYEGLCK